MIKLDHAMLNVTKLGFDTSPFIYFVERHSDHVDLVREILRRVDTGIVRGYSSVVTLTEVLTQPKRVGNAFVENEYRDLLLHSHNLEIILIDIDIAEGAADLRARYQLRTPDALQIALLLTLAVRRF